MLRSNALSTGQNALRGLLGTAAGFVVGGVLVALIGTNTTVLWLLLPFAILFAGLAPAAISFAAGQAAFTLTLLILFNILAPEGWQIGLVRIEDVAIGGAVSLAVGLAVLAARRRRRARPGARRRVRRQRARTWPARCGSASGRCDRSGAAAPAPTDEAIRAAAASRRLDDTFRTYLAERGAKPVPLAEVTAWSPASSGLRLAGDAVLDLWQRRRRAPRRPRRGPPGAGGDAASDDRLVPRLRRERSPAAGAVPDPLTADDARGRRLVEAVDHDLRGRTGGPPPPQCG